MGNAISNMNVVISVIGNAFGRSRRKFKTCAMCNVANVILCHARRKSFVPEKSVTNNNNDNGKIHSHAVLLVDAQNKMNTM